MGCEHLVSSGDHVCSPQLNLDLHILSRTVVYWWYNNPKCLCLMAKGTLCAFAWSCDKTSISDKLGWRTCCPFSPTHDSVWQINAACNKKLAFQHMLISCVISRRPQSNFQSQSMKWMVHVSLSYSQICDLWVCCSCFYLFQLWHSVPNNLTLML